MDFSTPIDDRTLAALKRDCRRTQEKVYRTYARSAWTLAVRLSGSEAAAWDAVQNGFVKAFERVAQLERADRFGAWLRRIVVNQVMDAGRRALDPLPEHYDAGVDAPDHDGALDLVRAFGQLDALDRAVLWLHDVEGLTHAEIADTLARSVPWSKTRLSRARAKARDLLHPHYEPTRRALPHGQ
ncbi:sigma-70 family RNA polymerase sigma factor [Wenzhouxiangella sp. XN79A]|uniref:RNA polymerase sigma factor n=1 Tax=Wenzhouxiangella sp. XN79A TaxID=2724193 RepID=UPI00144AA9F4|nr:sigma-70 family RNA polymerase sigma factor [Wenzhouxiangella sp. XN79A]NKI34050.1 sigma-70 family RNA polymerase sigma factor [Wenzhouxiangella sp. XN79A]